ncbi:LLM class flavin-dependent oxidoreductase [Yinghuangia soli]|uniref:LLM class flavin-dependent oxidoreductase n=1 Tax=Yinghuangia soli TaxID=2908204 RepID=A0AA41Q7A7_9ACTN|nr:LLM class flavin-dependent oxidoreductase [Yinghuangia soli]MCF2532026.1 LLM class flavin-dependent oxidoreductase [Yinghuangia soli]
MPEAAPRPAAAPFAAGSVSLRIYPHNELDAPGIAAQLLGHAALAAEAGFDGVMTSEHHGGFAGYLPNPLQVAGWMLDAMPAGWAAACPVLLPLRPPALLAEEAAWLAVRHPGRVGLGVAPGALGLDFRVMDADLADAVPRFRTGLPRLAAMLRGEDLGDLAGDRALAACADRPVPVLSTAMSPAAVRRAAGAGTGILYDGASDPARLRDLTQRYTDAGGTGARVLIRRVWLGDPPREAFERQHVIYQSYSADAAREHWRGTGFICRDDPAELAADLAAALRDTGATCLNLRVQVPGVSAGAARDQIRALGAHVLPLLRTAIRPEPEESA